jgi:hypothetical protein
MPAEANRMTIARHIALSAASLITAATLATAQDNATRSTKVVPERPARVFVMAGFGDDCKPTPAPQIAIDKPPGKGSVSLRENQVTTIQYSASGKCIGARIPGTGIYYTAAKGARGSDTFAISARLASGEVATRSFTVEIAEY